MKARVTELEKELREAKVATSVCGLQLLVYEAFSY